ncbi:MAG TPA: glycosyltransferase family 4 protein [Candidatus Dormibacteraeota bacterium]|nr:glycosyltransferase family 4 protein [Candidatus Dormibacteraeota bacterium]
MKLLLLSQFYPPIGGGQAGHVQSLARAMAARGHSVAVATIGTEGSGGDDGMVRVHRLHSTVQHFPFLFSDVRRPYAPPLPDPGLVAGLRRVVERERPDLIHAHDWTVHSALPMARRYGASLLLTLHDYGHACATKRLMLHGKAICPGPAPSRCLGCAAHHYGPVVGAGTAVATMAFRRSRERRLDGVIAVSAAVALGSGLDRGRVPFQVIPNFLPDGVWEAGGDRGAPAEPFPAEPFILFVGDLVADKGLDVLLTAYRTTAGLPPLVLIGRRVRRTPTDLPEGVRMMQDCPHSMVMRGLHSCTVAVAPSVWPDPCPTAVLEAMAAGCPLVTTPVGGITDMLTPEENALMVPAGDATALVTALVRLCHSPDLRERLGRAARERASLFTAAMILPRIEAAYEAALGDRGVASAPAQLIEDLW